MDTIAISDENDPSSSAHGANIFAPLNFATAEIANK